MKCLFSTRALLFAVFVLSAFFLSSCEKDSVTEEVPINRRPSIEAPPAVSAIADSLFVLDLVIEDLDGDELMVDVENRPAWLDFDATSYRLSGTPTRQDVGPAKIMTVVVSDGTDERTKDISIQVLVIKSLQEKLDESLQSLWLNTTTGLTGVSAAVVTPGGQLLTSTAGQRDEFGGGPARPGYRYRVASVSKIFTAALLLRLEEEGMLQLDDALYDYLPISGLPNGEQITLRQMLTHTSGLADHLNDGSFWSGSNGPWDTQDIVDYAVEEGLIFTPGTGYSYSNTGFHLLGAVIEEVTGQTLAKAHKAWIFSPLELQQTLFDDFSSFGSTIDSLARNARSYEYHLSAAGAAGAVVSTPTDIARFGHALYGGNWLEAASLEAMLVDYGFAVGGDHYGLGTRLWDDSGYIHHGHTGALMDYRSILMYVPSKGVTIALSTNDTHPNWYDLVNSILATVASHF